MHEHPSPARILIVDDQPDIGDVVAEYLNGTGYIAAAVTSAAAARAAIDSEPPELAIIDALLQGESGIDFANYAASRGVRVMLMTGDFTRLEAIEKVGFAILRKPFRLAELARLVEAVLDTE